MPPLYTLYGITVVVHGLYVRDVFHVYLNKFEFHFLRVHINKTNKFCFFMHNGRAFGIAPSRQDGNSKHI